MTVAARPASVSYQEDGQTVSFPAPFRFKSARALVVERIRADGSILILQLGVDYTVSGGATDAGGTVTRTAATSGAILRIRRWTERAQSMTYTTGDRFPASSHEEALDQLMLVSQEQDALQDETSSRSLMVPSGEAALDLPIAAVRAGAALVFNEAGQPVAKPIGSFPPGPTGPANSTFLTRAALKAAPVTNRVYNFEPEDGEDDGLLEGKFGYRAGPFAIADEINVVEIDGVPLTTGALVRQTADSLSYQRNAPGSVPLALKKKAAETLSASEFGITPSTSDDSAAVGALVAAMNSNPSAVRLDGGDIRSRAPFQISSVGIDAYGVGATRLYGTGTDQGAILGATNDQGLSLTTALAGDMAKGASTVKVTSTAGYYVGQSVLVIGGRSMHSSPGNPIPVDKQWFTIRAIDAAASTLSFTGQAETAFTVANAGEITKATAPIAVQSSLRNLNVTNDATFSGPYSQSINGARCVSVRDCIIDGYSAATFQAFCDHAVYENVAMVGYNGISPARGTKRIVFRDCSYEPRYETPQGYCAFIEESSSDVLVDNFRARGGQFKITASGDDAVRKRVLVKNLDLNFNPAQRLEGGRGYINCPAIETIFSSTSDGFARFDGGMIVTPGGNVGGVNVGDIPKCAVYIDSSSKVQFHDMHFAGLDPDAWAIAVNGNNSYRLEIERCRIVDGSGRGLCHPSVLSNLSVNPDACTVSRIKDLEIAYTVGTAQVRTTLTWLPREGYMLARHQFLNVPPGTYQVLKASKPNGVHSYELSAHASGTGRSIATKLSVAQDFNSAPVVTPIRALGQTALTVAQDGVIGTRGTVTIVPGSEIDNLIVTVSYDLTDADPNTAFEALVATA